jgi:hypothetical protein
VGNAMPKFEYELERVKKTYFSTVERTNFGE